MKRIVLDCDPGIDDALAIILAAKSSQLKIEAITSASGNLRADQTAINALKVLELIDKREIPVYQGMLKPLVRNLPHDPFSHGDDGLGNTGLPAPRIQIKPGFGPDAILDTVSTYPGEITLVATAPLTNVAMAIQKSPEIMSQVKEIIIIAGAFGFNQYAAEYATGDNPTSEWNVYVDPEAAKIVFHAGIPLTAIGLDVATQPAVSFATEHIQQLKQAGTKEAKFLLDIIDFLKERDFEPYCVLIDSFAVAVAIDANLIETKRVHVDIETRGEYTLGQTVTDFRKNFTWKHLPEIEAAYNADFKRFMQMVVKTVTERGLENPKTEKVL
jgi:inosine-uridine nucleoside N-ribohydrolase